MRFAIGQVFESVADGRQAVVAQIRDDGRAGLLRLLDSGHEQWFLWPQFHHDGKWLPIGMKEAAN